MRNLQPQGSKQNHVRNPEDTLQGQQRQHSDREFAFSRARDAAQQQPTNKEAGKKARPKADSRTILRTGNAWGLLSPSRISQTGRFGASHAPLRVTPPAAISPLLALAARPKGKRPLCEFCLLFCVR